MRRLIAVDGQGCHYFAVEISENRYHRPKYMEALNNSILMVFKKLKYHKGKLDITINEEEFDGPEQKTATGQPQGEAGIIKDGEDSERSLGESDYRYAGQVLAGGETAISPDEDAHRVWNKGIQEELSKRERQNKFLQTGNVENLHGTESGVDESKRTDS